ncbi:hypothetical protein FB45DRAFT_1067237 [Roridomyces roridus]|uniref:Uncharacterized protein n=1 Tax=Roridomyces roridus TaxID=1738132 RepID=A0AAD7FAR6_9AGAR|nr:hypothetical protein FB45DRAFT_1067237 [Roridomyces roridus]
MKLAIREVRDIRNALGVFLTNILLTFPSSAHLFHWRNDSGRLGACSIVTFSLLVATALRRRKTSFYSVPQALSKRHRSALRRSGVHTSEHYVPIVQLAELNGPKLLAAATNYSTVVTPGPIIEPALIAGAVVAVIIAVPFIIMLCRRKRVPSKKTSITSQPSLPEPESGNPEPAYNIFHTSWQEHADDLRSIGRTLTSSSSASTTRQLYISNQINRAREKVKELEELSSFLLRSASSASNIQSDPQKGAEPQAADTIFTAQEDNPGLLNRALEERLRRALDDIEQLNLRMQEMERQRESEWALGLSDEFPPGYSELE